MLKIGPRRSLSTHETFVREDNVKRPSVRSLGLTFFVAFSLIGILPLLRGHSIRWWSVAIAAIMLGLTFVCPRLLEPLNRAWHILGLMLHRAVSPVIMALLYYTVVTPMGLLLRALGKDLLVLRFDRTATTYWIERLPPGPAPDTMSRQF